MYNKSLQLDNINKLRQLIVPHPAINLGPNNACFFQCKILYGVPHTITKTKTKNKKGLVVGVGVPVVGHLGVGVGKRIGGGSKTKVSTKTIIEKIPGHLLKTWDAYYICTPGNIIRIDYDNITGLTLHRDGLLIQATYGQFFAYMSQMDIERYQRVSQFFGSLSNSNIELKDILN